VGTRFHEHHDEEAVSSTDLSTEPEANAQHSTLNEEAGGDGKMGDESGNAGVEGLRKT
jgi:hypothetical protein